MTPISELRIGNYLKSDTGKTIRVTDIDSAQDGISAMIVSLNKKGGYRTGYFEPIPLTEELLEKCGFKYDGGYYVKGVLFSTFQQDHSEQIFVGTPGGGIATNAKHLHQLQNLYHAMTGKELDISELQNDGVPSGDQPPPGKIVDIPPPPTAGLSDCDPFIPGVGYGPRWDFGKEPLF